MTIDFIPIEHYRNKFYQRGCNYKNFTQLTEEKLSLLAKKVYKDHDIMVSVIPKWSENMWKLERYQRTLQYLTNPLIQLDIRTFDEKVAYLIMMTDPDLVTFKEFLKINLISLEEIKQVEDIKERNYLRKIRTYTISSYENIVREKIGFYDLRLLKYEEMFFKRFFNKKELITEIGINNQDNFIANAMQVNNFNSITDERFNELFMIAETWKSLVKNEFNTNVATYSVTKQSELFGLNSLIEQVTLFILLVDSNLEMLSIYEEESTMKNIEERIRQQFGYFNKDLLSLERKFYERFCPDKELSIWAKRRKY